MRKIIRGYRKFFGVKDSTSDKAVKVHLVIFILLIMALGVVIGFRF
ncbi:MAG TPA: hypothetical protein VHD35_08340 [Chitinophagaceae bacterium]|jgi:hypothetical protein|nr:hypothetical protein [Chitinophagaceae bacterium]